MNLSVKTCELLTVENALTQSEREAISGRPQTLIAGDTGSIFIGCKGDLVKFRERVGIAICMVRAAWFLVLHGFTSISFTKKTDGKLQ